MKTTSFIKKSIILGLTVSLLGMSVYANSDSDDVYVIDESEIMLVNEPEVQDNLTATTGTILVKQKKSKTTVYLTYGGKKKYTLEPAADTTITVDELVSFNGKIVKIKGYSEKKNLKVVDIRLIVADPDDNDAK